MLTDNDQHNAYIKYYFIKSIPFNHECKHTGNILGQLIEMYI